MSTGRLTWRNERWSRGSIVEELPRFRTRYGIRMALAVETVRNMLADHLGQPRAQDVRETLKAIRDRGREVPIHLLDAQTDCELMRQSYRLFGTEYFERLPDEALRQCAAAALQEFDRPGGSPPTDAFVVPLVRRLDDLWLRRLRHRELNLMRKRLRRSFPAIPKRKGPPTAEEAEQLERELFKMLRRALRSCGVRGLTDSNIDRLLNKPG